MSVLFYKFKSAKAFDTINFDGPGISVFDLKRDIMIQKKLGKATDFDLYVFNAQTNDVYDDDAFVIQRNTSVLVARLAVPKGARLNAQRTSNNVEEEGISLMFKQQREQWDLAQDQMAAVKPVFRPTMGGMGAQGRQIESIKPPPPGYTCFRCGEKGHFINACPTIGDKDFDNKPKIKKATGIPSMFLKTITNKDSFEGAMMVTQDGDLVQAVPNDDSWKRMQAQGFHNLGADSAYNTAPILPELQCHICQRLLRDAVESPCCNTSYCEPCINAELNFSEDVTMRFKCPNCRAVLRPADLKTDNLKRAKVVEHLREHSNERKRKAEEELAAIPSKSSKY